MANFVTSPPAVLGYKVAKVWERSKGTVCNDTAHKIQERCKMWGDTKWLSRIFDRHVILIPKLKKTVFWKNDHKIQNFQNLKKRTICESNSLCQPQCNLKSIHQCLTPKSYISFYNITSNGGVIEQNAIFVSSSRRRENIWHHWIPGNILHHKNSFIFQN